MSSGNLSKQKEMGSSQVLLSESIATKMHPGMFRCLCYGYVYRFTLSQVLCHSLVNATYRTVVPVSDTICLPKDARYPLATTHVYTSSVVDYVGCHSDPTEVIFWVHNNKHYVEAHSCQTKQGLVHSCNPIIQMISKQTSLATVTIQKFYKNIDKYFYLTRTITWCKKLPLTVYGLIGRSRLRKCKNFAVRKRYSFVTMEDLGDQLKAILYSFYANDVHFLPTHTRHLIMKIQDLLSYS